MISNNPFFDVITVPKLFRLFKCTPVIINVLHLFVHSDLESVHPWYHPRNEKGTPVKSPTVCKVYTRGMASIHLWYVHCTPVVGLAQPRGVKVEKNVAIWAF